MPCHATPCYPILQTTSCSSLPRRVMDLEAKKREALERAQSKGKVEQDRLLRRLLAAEQRVRADAALALVSFLLLWAGLRGRGALGSSLWCCCCCCCGGGGLSGAAGGGLEGARCAAGGALQVAAVALAPMRRDVVVTMRTELIAPCAPCRGRRPAPCPSWGRGSGSPPMTGTQFRSGRGDF